MILLHYFQCGIQATTGRDTETRAFSIILQDTDEFFQRLRITQQVLVQVSDQGTIMVEHRPALQLDSGDRFTLVRYRLDQFEVSVDMGLP